MRRRNLRRWHRLVFARQQLLFALPLLTDLPVGDCIMPLLAAVNALKGPFSEFWLETADTNEAKELSGLIKKFEKPFRSVLEKAGKLPRNKLELPRLHRFFLGSAAAYVAFSLPGNSSTWPLSIPRLRMPRAAPSRSTLKPAEAFMEFVGDRNAEERLRARQTAVDLGAAPGARRLDLATGAARNPRCRGRQRPYGQNADGRRHQGNAPLLAALPRPRRGDRAYSGDQDAVAYNAAPCLKSIR